jgi:alpha-amylase/alpha-mannosidase (GH57 family)
MSDHFLCVHGHCYQPPRGNPFRHDEPVVEPEAAPYADINEKAAALAYTPNATLGNFELMSFSIGNALARWMEKGAPETYRRIVEAEANYRARYGFGNALAHPAHHLAMPLHSRADQDVLVRWGVTTFEHRFGHSPLGMWLPNLAVNLETLDVLRANGLAFTILSQAQVSGAEEGAGPYWVKLPGGDRFAVYLRDDELSNTLAFGIRGLGGAGRWARGKLMPIKKEVGRLVLIAVEGETFGYHHPGEESFLRWLLAYEANAVGYTVTTLSRDLHDFPPTAEVGVREYTAWNSARELQRWRGNLRAAFDNLSARLDTIYRDYVRSLGADADSVMREYIRVRLGLWTETDLHNHAGLTALTSDQSRRLITLLQSQFHRLRMYTSAAFFYEDLNRAETRFAVADAVMALRLAATATDYDLLPMFRLDLAQVAPDPTGCMAVSVLEEVLAWEAATKESA